MKQVFLVADKWALKILILNKMTILKDNTHFNLKTCDKLVGKISFGT